MHSEHQDLKNRLEAESIFVFKVHPFLKILNIQVEIV